jgi:hypothetical protein
MKIGKKEGRRKSKIREKHDEIKEGNLYQITQGFVTVTLLYMCNNLMA